tara:strand:+ start:207 stop:497 length:291 start_codon:yes stop_codon:yes gene_type:complete
MKNIMKVLTAGVSLEQEFEVKKSITAINELTDIEDLKPYTIHLLKTNSNQAAFIASALEIICQQQEQIYKLRKKNNKKATLMSRIKFVLFGKKSGN